MLIKAENISKFMAAAPVKFTALHRANLEIASGEFLSVMGAIGKRKEYTAAPAVRSGCPDGGQAVL